MVAVAGFGGRLMRTVSFFGCTLAASVGFGGTPPVGLFGGLSAIVILVSYCKLESVLRSVKP
jgi:hypothetical protein